MTPLDFVLEREVRRYEADLDLWARRVASARSAEDAIRAALLRPSPGGFVRAVRCLYRRQEQRAEHAVDLSLAAALDRVEDPAEAARCVQLARRSGPLPPSLRRWLDSRRRLSRASGS